MRLCLHSGSDKFALYPAIRDILCRTGAGLHVKAAGTTWLEEFAGPAAAGGGALSQAKEVYRQAWPAYEELVAPYAAVVDIRRERLPSPDEIRRWSAAEFVAAVVHDPTNPAFQPDLRQFLHVAYPVAARMSAEFLSALDAHRSEIEPRVTSNLLVRHLRPCSPPKRRAVRPLSVQGGCLRNLPPSGS